MRMKTGFLNTSSLSFTPEGFSDQLLLFTIYKESDKGIEMVMILEDDTAIGTFLSERNEVSISLIEDNMHKIESLTIYLKKYVNEAN